MVLVEFKLVVKSSLTPGVLVEHKLVVKSSLTVLIALACRDLPAVLSFYCGRARPSTCCSSLCGK